MNGQTKWPIAKKNQIKLWDAPTLNIDLQEGMALKGIYYIHLHTPKYLQRAM